MDSKRTLSVVAVLEPEPVTETGVGDWFVAVLPFVYRLFKEEK